MIKHGRAVASPRCLVEGIAAIRAPTGRWPGRASPAAVQTGRRRARSPLAGVRFPGINKGLNGGRGQTPGACIRCESSTRHALRAVAIRVLHDAAALAHEPDGLAARFTADESSAQHRPLIGHCWERNVGLRVGIMNLLAVHQPLENRSA